MLNVFICGLGHIIIDHENKKETYQNNKNLYLVLVHFACSQFTTFTLLLKILLNQNSYVLVIN